MDQLVLPEGAKPWLKLAYDNPEADWYENVPDGGFDFFHFYERVGWKEDEVWVQRQKDKDLLGGIEQNAIENPPKSPWQIDRFFQTWLLFGTIVEVFRLSGVVTKTDEFLAPITVRSVRNPQTARLVTTAKLPDLIQQWRQAHQKSRDTSVFHRALQILDFVGKTVDFHCANGKDHRSIHQYGKVLWAVSAETTTAIIAVAYTLRRANYSIYNETNDERWPVTNSPLLYQRIQRKWCRSDVAMIMEDFDIDGQYYIASATGRTVEELDGHYGCTDQSCEAKISDGTYVIQHDPECHEDDYDPEPKFAGHVYPELGKSPASVRDAITGIMDAGCLPVLRWDTEQKGLTTYGHEKDVYSEDSSKCPPFVAISHV
jgi:hypothetical protein